MRVLIGLGNPGEEYAKSRHNAGFWFIDALSEAVKATGIRQFKGGELIEFATPTGKAAVFKPMQFMNRSGMPIQDIVRFYGLEVDQICIACDDVYIAPGSVRIRRGGGDGGHNGLKSVLEHIKPDTFWRVKIGVGIYEQHPEKRVHQPALDDYVLQPLPAHERKLVTHAIDNTVPNLVQWLEHGTLVEETIHS